MQEEFKVRRGDGKSVQRMEQMFVTLHGEHHMNVGDKVILDNCTEYEYNGSEWVVLESENVTEVPLGLMSMFKKPYKYKTNKSINKRKKNSLYKNKGSYYGM
ncbi:MAG: hypothetical protein GY853_15625 [PVC group bacterium]|nr:hypothetical protein [PVC group bacterium]